MHAGRQTQTGRQRDRQYMDRQTDRQNVPVNVSVQGLIPANLFDVPKSDIFRTPL